ncbi:large-conductance mechanosensitive channel [Planctomyces bekefii]|uniref:Large-conductance mechanosensitive channel n=1 Tax=Planctomyces bekefii TaxID=1653850 RepID=A0A5C6MGV2_9PLAN|nr:large-conductance mechanosensitive channel [Planctomyces bekefii]
MKSQIQSGATGAAKHLTTVLDEFRNFAFKGNIVDMAVGVIVGGAFGKIVDSLVKNILMPVIGLLTPGEHGYLGWKIVVGAKEVPYGLFLGECVNFLIVAFTLYIFMVKFLGFLLAQRTKTAAAPTAPVAPVETAEEKLLKEIRDLLAKR